MPFQILSILTVTPTNSWEEIRSWIALGISVVALGVTIYRFWYDTKIRTTNIKPCFTFKENIPNGLDFQTGYHTFNQCYLENIGETATILRVYSEAEKKDIRLAKTSVPKNGVFEVNTQHVPKTNEDPIRYIVVYEFFIEFENVEGVRYKQIFKDSGSGNIETPPLKIKKK